MVYSTCYHLLQRHIQKTPDEKEVLPTKQIYLTMGVGHIVIGSICRDSANMQYVMIQKNVESVNL